MLKVPFYDPSKSYEDNYEEGPFGSFADGVDLRKNEEPKYDFQPNMSAKRIIIAEPTVVINKDLRPKILTKFPKSLFRI